ncbi:MAG: LacI family transcriptional regulator [Deinococcus sp.]|nr:LacI family transcriptional regulator [Deinococcus sp.]
MAVKEVPTIHDVATLAGVSTGTVSRVLNKRPGVHPETRVRVQEVVERLGYTPSAVARELSGKGEALGILMAPGTRRLTPYFTLLYEMLVDAVWREGLRVEETLVDNAGLPLLPAKAYIMLGAHDHDHRVEHMERRKLPFVLLGVYPGAFWVAPDDIEGAYQATRHLLELGHRKILHVSGRPERQAERERIKGYRKALKEYGVNFEANMVIDGEFSTLQAYRKVRKVWEEGLRFSAVFAASDEMAVGTVAALEDLGIQVPKDVSVVGFDDLPELSTGLTTVRQDIAEIARTCVRLAKDAITGAKPYGVRVPVQLVVRGTTALRG